MNTDFPNGRAVVKAGSLEVSVGDPRVDDVASIHLRCGHCHHSSCSRSTPQCMDPASGESYEEQVRYWRERLSKEAVCPQCGVRNTCGDAESFLRQHREESEANGMLHSDYDNSPLAFVNAGRRRERDGFLGQAEDMYRDAIHRFPDLAAAHLALADLHRQLRALTAALVDYEQVIRLKPDYAEAYCGLGDVLERLGRFAEAVEARRRGHELGSQQTNWQLPSAKWLRRSERFLKLEPKLPPLLERHYMPNDNTERLELAFVCQAKKYYVAAARLYGDVFDQDAGLADDENREHLYEAACAAILAGRGYGLDAPPDAAARRHWLQRSLEWMRACLASAKRHMADGERSSVQDVQRWLSLWKRNGALAGDLPDDNWALEMFRWREFWSELSEIERKVYENFGIDDMCLSPHTIMDDVYDR